MSENESAEATAAETTEEEVQATETETESSSAETENTEGTPEGYVTKESFKKRVDKLVGDRDQLQVQLDSLKAQLEAKPEAVQEKVSDEIPEPPPGSTEVEALRHYVKHIQAALVREETGGLTLAEIAKMVKAVPSLSQSSQERRWIELCKEHGVDPADKNAQKYAAFEVERMSASPEQAVANAAKYLKGLSLIPKETNGKAEPKPKPKASVETEGATGNFRVSDKVPKNETEAVEMAEQGLRAPHRKMSDILAGKINKGK